MPATKTTEDNRPPTSRIVRWRDRAINLFLIFHLLAILCWCLPFESLPFVIGKTLVRPYFVWSGLFQSWDMFSPSPSRTNSYLEAEIVYEDGTTEYWEFPRMERLSYIERYSKERYRKFEENLRDERYYDTWPDVASYIARQAKGPKRPQMVMLIANWSDLVKNDDGSFTDSPWKSRVFYRYRVEPEDFN